VSVLPLVQFGFSPIKFTSLILEGPKQKQVHTANCYPSVCCVSLFHLCPLTYSTSILKNQQTIKQKNIYIYLKLTLFLRFLFFFFSFLRRRHPCQNSSVFSFFGVCLFISDSKLSLRTEQLI